MFAGLALEGSDDGDASDNSDEAAPQPAKPQPKPRGVTMPEADSDEDDANGARTAASHHSILGDIDPDDLAITIETLQAISKDLTLFRSRPFKALREAIGPLARDLTGDGGGRGGGGRARQRHGSRLGALDPTERYKQMDRDALNHRVLRAERLERLEQLSLEEGDGLQP